VVLYQLLGLSVFTLPVLDRVVCVFLRGPPLLRLPTVKTKEYVIVPLYYDRLCVQLSNPVDRTKGLVGRVVVNLFLNSQISCSN